MQKTIVEFARNLARQPWGLWWIQARRMTRIELRRNLFSWKAGWVYFLAQGWDAAPLFVGRINVIALPLLNVESATE